PVGRHRGPGVHAGGMVQELVIPGRLLLTNADVGQVRPEPAGAEKDIPVVDVITGHGPPYAPFTINVASFVLVPDILRVTIDAAVGRIDPKAFNRRSGQ